MLWHPKTFQHIAICNVFSLSAVFPLPEAYKNDPKFDFNTLLSSDTQKSSKNLAPSAARAVQGHDFHHPFSVRNRFCPSWDIATAILTNVIEHLVWLFSTKPYAIQVYAFISFSCCFVHLACFGSDGKKETLHHKYTHWGIHLCSTQIYLASFHFTGDNRI